MYPCSSPDSQPGAQASQLRNGSCPVSPKDSIPSPDGGNPDVIKLFTTESLNCHGFKQSHEFVLSRINYCDILCLCETWLRPNELNLIDEIIEGRYSNEKFTVFSKSSMNDIDVSYTGRPFGGLSVICKHSSDFKYHLLDVLSDRIMCICVTDATGKPVQVVFSIYMPFFNSNIKQTEVAYTFRLLMCYKVL